MSRDKELLALAELVRWAEGKHGPFDHAYIKDEKRCDTCKMIAAAKQALATNAQPREQDSGGEAVALTADEREWLEYAVAHMEDDSEPEDKTCGVVLQRLLDHTAEQPAKGDALAWALRQGGILADWCNLAGDALKSLMQAYERRVRSSCESIEDIEKKPWRCAEYVQAEDALRTKPVPVVEIEVEATRHAPQPSDPADGEIRTEADFHAALDRLKELSYGLKPQVLAEWPSPAKYPRDEWVRAAPIPSAEPAQRPEGDAVAGWREPWMSRARLRAENLATELAKIDGTAILIGMAESLGTLISRNGWQNPRPKRKSALSTPPSAEPQAGVVDDATVQQIMAVVLRMKRYANGLRPYAKTRAVAARIDQWADGIVDALAPATGEGK